EARNNQAFTQFVNFNGINFGDLYVANSSLHWTDWGARLGLDAKWAATNAITVGLGGNIGFAGRSVSLAASDACGCAGFNGASTISTATATTPFLANAEASLAVKPASALTIRSFIGLNYDSRVP